MSNRLKAWVHNVSTNPLNDDQLLLANDVAALLDQLTEARGVIEFIAGRQSYPSLDETEKARAFLNKHGIHTTKN